MREKGAWRRDLVSDADRADRNHMERDRWMAEGYRREVQEWGLPFLEVDGTLAAVEVAAQVYAHFAPLLLSVKRD